MILTVWSCSAVSAGVGVAVAAVQEGWMEFTPSRKCSQYGFLEVVSPSRICQGLALGVVAVAVVGDVLVDLHSSSQEGMQVPSCQNCFTEQSGGG